MEKILAIVLTALMMCNLVACGDPEPKELVSTEAETKIEVEASKEESVVEKQEEPVTITYCNFSASGDNEAVLDNMYEAFQVQYPHIIVEIETIGYADYFTQMQTRVAGGTAPDSYELNIENFAAYSSKGILAEIKDVDTSGINPTALTAFNVDNTQYGLPGSFSNVILIFNKDLFDEANIGYPTGDWTWEDAQLAADAIRSLGDEYYGIFAPITYNEFFKVAAQYGGSVLNEDKTEFTVNSSECIAAAENMVERVTVSNVQPNLEQQGGLGDWDWFMSGKLGMIPTGIWAFSTFEENCDFAWDIVVEPGQQQKATHFFSNALVINNDIDPTKLDAASAWINFLASSPEAAELRINAGWDLPAITDEAILKTYVDIEVPENREAVFDSLDYLTVPPILEENALMADIITKHLELAASGKVEVEQAMNDAQAELETSITLP